MYWLFTALSTEIYILMYVMMFTAAIYLKIKHVDKHRPFSIPGGRIGYYFTCGLGLMGCLMTLIVGFFPPEQSMDVGGANHFRLIFIIGMLLVLLPAWILYLYRDDSRHLK